MDEKATLAQKLAWVGVIERPDVLAPRITPTGMAERPDILAPQLVRHEHAMEATTKRPDVLAPRITAESVIETSDKVVGRHDRVPDPVPKPAEDPIARRAAMVAWCGDLPAETKDAITQVRLLSSKYVWDLQAAFKRAKVDVGRAIATIDHVQQTHYMAIDALVLPHMNFRSE